MDPLGKTQKKTCVKTRGDGVAPEASDPYRKDRAHIR
jgi:hypothetical protein